MNLNQNLESQLSQESETQAERGGGRNQGKYQQYTHKLFNN